MTGGRSRGPRPNARARMIAAEGRWRRAQLARRRRLTLRGRLTIAAGLLFMGLVIGWIVDPVSPVLASLEPRSVETPLPQVSAGAPPVRPPSPEMPVAPDALLKRLPITRAALELPSQVPAHGSSPRLYEHVDVSGIDPALAGPLRVQYSLDAELTRHVFRVLRKGRVKLGNVVLLDPTTGRVLAYASTDVERFPPTRNYPAASLIKVITAAAALDLDPKLARLPCRYRGSPYRLTPSRIDPPERGREVSLRRALATSNNQCFAQLAVHAVGQQPLLDAIGRFGWLDAPAVAHAPGAADPGEERYDVGRLGCGLSGCRITPLHAAQLAATLVHGELVTPRWIERITDAEGSELRLPAAAAPRRVLSPELTAELRSMLVDTTRSGTARNAFQDRRGRPLLGPVKTAGKTGSLSGKDPDGRYEWFIGVAPAESPRVAVATVLVQGDLWWRNASQVAADVLRGVFCEKSRCREELADRFIQLPATTAALATVPAAAEGAP